MKVCPRELSVGDPCVVNVEGETRGYGSVVCLESHPRTQHGSGPENLQATLSLVYPSSGISSFRTPIQGGLCSLLPPTGEVRGHEL